MTDVRTDGIPLKRLLRSEIYVEDKTVASALVLLRMAFKRIGTQYAEGELVDWMMNYLEQKYGRVLVCEKCGKPIQVKCNHFRSRCPKCEHEHQNEIRRSENLTDAQRKKRKEQAKAFLERLKESGRQWKQRMADIKAGKDVQIPSTCVRKLSKNLVVKTGILARTRGVKFIDYVDSFVSRITGQRMMIRVMSLIGTGDENASSVVESNLIAPIKALGVNK